MAMQTFWTMPRASGALLIAGFAAHAAGVLMWLSRQGAGAPRPAAVSVERGFIMAAVVLTSLGLVLLEGLFVNRPGQTLARTAATAYLFAGVVLVVAEAIGLRDGLQKVYSLVVIYVVLAFAAQAAAGGALLQSAQFPAWIAWITIAWNLGWLVVLPLAAPADIYYPVLHHAMPLLIGLPLLWRG